MVFSQMSLRPVLANTALKAQIMIHSLSLRICYISFSFLAMCFFFQFLQPYQGIRCIFPIFFTSIF